MPGATNGLMASTPDGRGRSLGPRADASASPPPWREPADDRLGPGEPVLLARGVEQVVERGQRLGEARAADPRVMSYQENPGGAATGPRGSTVAKWPSGSR